MKQKSIIERLREDDPGISKLIIWDFHHIHIPILKDNTQVSEIVVVTDSYHQNSCADYIKSLLNQNTYMHTISFLKSDYVKTQYKQMYKGGRDVHLGVFTPVDMNLDAYAHSFTQDSNVNAVLAMNKHAYIQLQNLSRIEHPLTEYTIETTKLYSQILKFLAQSKKLRKIIIASALDFNERFKLNQLLDENTGINEIEAHSNALKEEVCLKLSRNKAMYFCETAQSGEYPLEFTTSEELKLFLAHPKWDDLIPKMQCVFVFNCPIVEGDLFQDERMVKFMDTKKIQLMAYHYVLPRRSNTKNLVGLKASIDLLKGVRAISTPAIRTHVGPRVSNSLNYSDFNYLIELVKSNAAIHKIKLVRAGITDERMYQLADAIKTNTKLVFIDLSRNDFTITAAKAFFGAVVADKFITDIKMEDVNIEGKYLQSIAKILACNQALLTLCITPRVTENDSIDRSWASYGYSGGASKGYYKKDSGCIERYVTKNQGNRDQAVILIQREKKQELQRLLQRGVSPNARDEQGRTLLHHAVMKGNLAIFKSLREQGACIELTDKKGKTCLDLCQSEEEKRKYLEIKSAPRQGTVHEFFPTKKRKRDENTLSEGADLQSNEVITSQPKRMKVSDPHDPPAHLDEFVLRFLVACRNGDISLVEAMYAENSTQTDKVKLVNVQNEYGKTPAHLAAYGGHSPVLAFLISKGANLALIDSAGRLPLHDAAICKNPEKIKSIFECLLVGDSSKVDARDRYGLTPLYLLAGGFESHPAQADRHNAAGVYVLLAKGASPNLMIKDLQLNREMCALHKAVYNGFYYVMKAIVQSRMRNINAQDAVGNGVLHYAVLNQRPVNVYILKRLLIEPDINTSLTNRSQATALALLKKNAETPVVKKMEACIAERELRYQLGDRQSGIVWTKSMRVFYGAREDKDLVIDVSDAHESLKNSVKHRQNDKGNSVSARLTFIVSDAEYKQGGQHHRIAVPVKLVFAEKIHSSNMWQYLKPVGEEVSTSFFKPVKQRSPDALERILRRYQIAPADIKENCIDHLTTQNKSPFSDNAVQAAYKSTEHVFEYSFHHSEQALFDHLEALGTIENIIEALQKQPEFKEDSKVYAVILSIHSKLYVCVNCEISLLGEHKILSENLGKALKQRGYSLPKQGIRLLTTVSTDYEAKRQRQTLDEHGQYTVDIRSLTSSGLILSQDTRVVGSKDTMYVSRRS